MSHSRGEIQTVTLANGLTLIGEPNQQAETAGVGFFVKTGSRDEVAGEAGVSHFLEHMMFKGTARRTSLDITYEMGNIAARSNAFTSEEATVYYGGIVPEFFDSMHDILCDMLRPSLDPDEFGMEKKVILEEIALYLDRPEFFLRERAQEDFFTGHTAGNSVLGSRESITALSRDQMAAYFNRRYVPSNMVLAAAGKFDWDRFVEQSTARCGSWPVGVAGRQVSRHAPPAGALTLYRPRLNQAHVLLFASSASLQDDERIPLSLLASLLSDGAASGAYWKMVHTGLAESVGIDLNDRDGCGTFEASFSGEPDQVDKLRDILVSILDQPMQFTDEDLARTKRRLLSRIVLHGELPMGRMMDLGLSYLARGRVRTLQELTEAIEAVTRESISAALAKFPLQNWREYRMLPEK
jgi:predicted Zn-dependent peptidase